MYEVGYLRGGGLALPRLCDADKVEGKPTTFAARGEKSACKKFGRLGRGKGIVTHTPVLQSSRPTYLPPPPKDSKPPKLP